MRAANPSVTAALRDRVRIELRGALCAFRDVGQRCLIHPGDERPDDLADDATDVVHQKGFELAEEIRNETSPQGRMRRPLVATLQK